MLSGNLLNIKMDSSDEEDDDYIPQKKEEAEYEREKFGKKEKKAFSKQLKYENMLKRV
jgi:hypothetical protein